MSATRISGILEHRAVESGNLSVKPDLSDKDSNQQQWTKVEYGRGKNQDSSSSQQKEGEEGEEGEEPKPTEGNVYDILSSRKLNELFNQVIPEGSSNVNIYGRKFERSKAGKRINNIAGHMGVSIKLDKGNFLIRDVPDVGVIITTVPHSDFSEQASINVVGEKTVGDLMKVIKEAQQYNFFDLNLGFGDTGNCISTVGAAKYFLESRDPGVSIPYNINEEQCKQAHYDILVDQLRRYPELQEYLKSNEQGIQALMEELRSNPQFKELNFLVNLQQQQEKQKPKQPPVHDINIAYPQYKEIDRIAKGFSSTQEQLLRKQQPKQPQQEQQPQKQQQEQQ